MQALAEAGKLTPGILDGPWQWQCQTSLQAGQTLAAEGNLLARVAHRQTPLQLLQALTGVLQLALQFAAETVIQFIQLLGQMFKLALRLRQSSLQPDQALLLARQQHLHVTLQAQAQLLQAAEQGAAIGADQLGSSEWLGGEESARWGSAGVDVLDTPDEEPQS